MSQPESMSTGQELLPSVANGPRRAPSFPRQLAQCALIVALGFASYLLVTQYLLQSVRVVGVSMLPTLHDSQRYLMNRWIFYVRDPHAAEVVVLRDPMDQGLSVKRVIAVAGDTVRLERGTVYVNDHKLVEPYLAPGTPTFAAAPTRQQVFHCGAGQYFVLGDNRNASADSRNYGLVPRRNILGLILP